MNKTKSKYHKKNRDRTVTVTNKRVGERENIIERMSKQNKMSRSNKPDKRSKKYKRIVNECEGGRE